MAEFSLGEVSWEAKDTRRKVYLLLGEGHAQAAVSRVLKLSRQTINYHTKRLVSEGYLRQVRGTRSPALYTRTSKAFPEVDAKTSLENTLEV